VLDGKTVTEWAKLLKSVAASERFAAAAVLGKLGGQAKGAAPALVETAKKADKSLRGGAIAALSEVGADKDVLLPVVTEALKDDHVRVGFATVRALTALGPDAREAVPGLIDLYKRVGVKTTTDLTNPTDKALSEYHLKVKTLEVLGAVGPAAKEAVPFLAEVWKEKTGSYSLRPAAEMALQKIDQDELKKLKMNP
jgi:hypothetical protein